MEIRKETRKNTAADLLNELWPNEPKIPETYLNTATRYTTKKKPNILKQNVSAKFLKTNKV